MIILWNMETYMKKLVTFIVLALLLVACRTEPTASPTATPAFQASPLLVQDSPLPEPTEPAQVEPAPTSLPSPSADKGTVIGRFIDVETGEPPGETLPIFLGEFSPLESGDPLITMSPTSSPPGTIEASGDFVFLDVEPGTYAIVFWTPATSRVLSDPETQKPIVATLKAGEITDLGEVVVDLPGIP
jgi:hypothetical protein